MLMSRSGWLLLFSMTLSAASGAGQGAPPNPTVIPLWPGVAPGSEHWDWQEDESVGPNDTIRRVRNVVKPTLTVYLPPKAIATGTAMVICPGGGFVILAVDHEGHEVARWLNSLGVAAVVLKYRVRRTGDPGDKDSATREAREKEIIPLVTADGQQAMRVVRSHAAEWGITPNRVGIMGFSAGGFVTAAVALHHDASSRPDFAAPIYPGIEPGDFTVPADAPPLFLVHADDDKTVPPVDHSIRLYTAWKKANIPAELHIYSRGGHGFGMRKQNLPVDAWTDRLRDWLDVQGLLKPAR
jgi:acetyl esterase/lipase